MMADAAGDRRLTRRGFGRLTLATMAAGVALVRAGTGWARAMPDASRSARTIYVFDPSAEAVTGQPGCATCAACRRHAEHKRFVTREAADARRAHPHCRCAIRAVSVPAAEFVRMFGDSRDATIRGEYDVRW